MNSFHIFFWAVLACAPLKAATSHIEPIAPSPLMTFEGAPLATEGWSYEHHDPTQQRYSLALQELRALHEAVGNFVRARRDGHISPPELQFLRMSAARMFSLVRKFSIQREEIIPPKTETVPYCNCQCKRPNFSCMEHNLFLAVTNSMCCEIKEYCCPRNPSSCSECCDWTMLASCGIWPTITLITASAAFTGQILGDLLSYPCRFFSSSETSDHVNYKQQEWLAFLELMEHSIEALDNDLIEMASHLVGTQRQPLGYLIHATSILPHEEHTTLPHVPDNVPAFDVMH